MSFNMVADQVHSKMSVSEIAKVLVKLEMSGDRKKFKDMTEWDEKIRSVFGTFDLVQFLEEYSSIRVQTEQVSQVRVEKQISLIMSSFRKKKQASGKKSTKPKQEGKAETEDETESLYEANLRKNALEMANKLAKKGVQAEKRGARQDAIFLNPLTRVPNSKGSEQVNPEAKYLAKMDGVEYLFEIEDDPTKNKRLMSWMLLTGTIPREFDKALWKHVPIGDTFGLYAFLTTQFMARDRDEAAKSLLDKWGMLRKKKSELFVSFVARLMSS